MRQGLAAKLEGSPYVKHDREERDQLIRYGGLVLDTDQEDFRFVRVYLFVSSSVVGGSIHHF